LKSSRGGDIANKNISHKGRSSTQDTTGGDIPRGTKNERHEYGIELRRIQGGRVSEKVGRIASVGMSQVVGLRDLLKTRPYQDIV
jgi:hypothetical protein